MQPLTRLGLAVAATAVVAATAPTAHATPISGPRAVGSFYSPDDGASHAIIATTNNDLWEAFWWESTGVGRSVIAHFNLPITAVSAYYSPDGYRHAIVALSNGDIDDVRYHPCCGITTSFITSLAGWGGANAGVKSISVWLDAQSRFNMAFLTRWGMSDVLALYQKNGTAETSTLVGFYPNNSTVDVAGHHELWNGTNLVTVAVGSPTRLEQVWWYDGQTPADYTTVIPSSNTPWATRFPGPGQPAHSVVSLTASDAFCSWCTRFGPVEQIDLATSTGAVETFATNNSGGLLYPDYAGVGMRSVSGPFISPASGTYRRNTIVSQSNGTVWDMSALFSYGNQVWGWRNLGVY